MDRETLEILSSRIGGRMLLDEPLRNHTTFGIGGPCDVMVMPRGLSDIMIALEFIRSEALAWRTIGNGSNLLVSDDGFRGLVMKLTHDHGYMISREETLVCGAAAQLPHVSRYAAKMGLSGLEFAAGIPASIGGAIIMNAGTPKGTIAELVKSVSVISPEGELLRFHGDEMEFGYRHSALKGKAYVVLEAELVLRKGDATQIRENMEKMLLSRRQSQPIGARSAGSIFKNPSGLYAGQLIDRAGLKGARCGDAQISEKHANFIVNLGNATAKDVLALIALARNTVKEKFDTGLELEIECIGF
jgi:UDP-N-acetylmuramate dehydrogenase